MKSLRYKLNFWLIWMVATMSAIVVSAVGLVSISTPILIAMIILVPIMQQTVIHEFIALDRSYEKDPFQKETEFTNENR